ncbi:hypothetical protein NKR19_g2426 [Coniochaeta hoffmannii]|uniref:Uncharacterized protein n=1 Tax=Coniochaeta hoffmannii TaxID=91930 RepID=A0AA38VZU7_9PEZI|nr:hypothetical protein NKR19_g2426 [Coniochaeta hoffmannii]
MAGIVLQNKAAIEVAVALAGGVRNVISIVGTAIHSLTVSNRLSQTIGAELSPALIFTALLTSSIQNSG